MNFWDEILFPTRYSLYEIAPGLSFCLIAASVDLWGRPFE